MNQKRRSGLGRGLEALIPAAETEEKALLDLPVDEIAPNPRQPRRVFDDEELEGLAASIREAGVLQPIVVQEGANGEYHLIAGERRLRASRLAGLPTIPAVVRGTDSEMTLLAQALIENIQREDLRPLEEAAAYQELAESFDLTHEQVGEKVGKSRSAVSNSMRLLTLPGPVQRLIDHGELSAGHARALVGIEDAAFVTHVAEKAATEGWSVRMVEDAARMRKQQSDASKPPKLVELRPPAIVQLEERLADKLGAKVKITHRGTKGRVVINYASLDDLEKISRLVYDL